MSTYIYLYCKDHDPPMSSDGEVGQHLYDLREVRRMIKHRDLIVEFMKVLDNFNWDNHFASTTARFLSAHPKCQLGIYDEYKNEHPIIADCICKSKMVFPDDPDWPEGYTGQPFLKTTRNYSCERHER